LSTQQTQKNQNPEFWFLIFEIWDHFSSGSFDTREGLLTRLSLISKVIKESFEQKEQIPNQRLKQSFLRDLKINFPNV
jgi:hypothetical protein